MSDFIHLLLSYSFESFPHSFSISLLTDAYKDFARKDTSCTRVFDLLDKFLKSYISPASVEISNQVRAGAVIELQNEGHEGHFKAANKIRQRYKLDKAGVLARVRDDQESVETLHSLLFHADDMPQERFDECLQSCRQNSALKHFLLLCTRINRQGYYERMVPAKQYSCYRPMEKSVTYTKNEWSERTFLPVSDSSRYQGINTMLQQYIFRSYGDLIIDGGEDRYVSYSHMWDVPSESRVRELRVAYTSFLSGLPPAEVSESMKSRVLTEVGRNILFVGNVDPDSPITKLDAQAKKAEIIEHGAVKLHEVGSL